MRAGLRVLILIGLATLVGCGERQRLNPFDPANPITGGRPAGFQALAGDGLVRLEWSYVAADGLLGYELFRRAPGDPGFTQIGGLIPAAVTQTGDFGLPNGVDYTYQLYFVLDRGLGGSPAQDVAMPGPLVPWVADNGGAAVGLTADGRRVATRDPGYSGPTAVAADPALGLVWISDTAGGLLSIYSPSGATHVNVTTMATPASIALDPADGTAWVCDPNDDAVYHFQTNGTPATPAALTLIANPLDVATDPLDRSVWVCERDGNRVRHYDRTGAALGSVDLSAPSRVAVDSITHAAWATSFTLGKVYSISNVPAVRDSAVGLGGPIGIAVDPRRGRIWVADAAGNRVVALGRNAAVEFQVSTPGEPREVAVDLATGNAWVTLASAGKVIQISPAGVAFRSVGGIARPDGISLGVDP